MPKKFYKRKDKKNVVSKPISDKHILDVVHRDGKKFKIYKFKRTVRYNDGGMVPVDFFYNNTTSDAFFSFAFKLDDVPGYTEFLDLYDQYCIPKVELLFIPVSNTNISTGTNAQVSHLATVIDYDDDVVPANMTVMQQYENFRIHTPNKAVKISFRPAPARLVYDGLTPSYSMGTHADWLDILDPSTPHFSLKVGITAGSAAYISQWSVWVKYHLEFRSPR